MKQINDIKERLRGTYLTLGARLALATGPAANGAEDAKGANTTAPRAAGLLFAAVAVFAAALWLSLLLAHPAYAAPGAGGGGGDAVQGALQKAAQWLEGIMIALGTLGFLVSVCIKAVAGTNEGRHAMAHQGMAGSGIAVVAGLLAPQIIQIFAGFAGH